MLGSIPHQNLCFYHLPTRGRAGIKLRDAQSRNEKNEFTLCCQIINSLESVGMEGNRGYG